jgi:hypothetical protein
MRAIAKKFSTETVEVFDSAYSSRPIIFVRSKDMSQRSNSYTFSDSIIRFVFDLIASVLGDAYRTAGAAFREQLQQDFVVLHNGHEG